MTTIQDNIIYSGKRQLYREFYPVIPSLDRIMIVSTVLRYRRLNRRSHFINGRWENLYLDLDCFPGVSRVFTAAATAGKKLTGNPLIVPHSSNGFPKNEFWFNVAGPGESTGLHDHLKPYSPGFITCRCQILPEICIFLFGMAAGV